MNSRIRTLIGSLTFLAVACCAGCSDDFSWGAKGDFVKPTVAVMKFENRAPFQMGWNLSDGMADMLVARLVETKRFHVVERPEIDSVMNELRFQHSGATRDQRKAELGRLKNVQYLVKGTVTDFGHVSASRGFGAAGGWDIFGGSTRAVMGMTLYVVDVESGEIICSESMEESVRANDLAVKAVYKDVGFGGSTFYQTPLGRATNRVIDKAIKRIAAAIASRPWEPKIATVQPDGSVIINGGQDHGVKAGAEYDVVEAGQPILCPDTGDMIGRQPGKVLGRVRVYDVRDRYSLASVLSGRAGDFQPGQRCQKAQTPVATGFLPSMPSR